MKRVFVVEDEKIIRKGFIMTTQWDKYQMAVVGEASNGQEGLEEILKIKPDIVISDIKMPALDGLEMMRQVYEHYEPVVLYITAYDDFAYAKQAIELQAIDYLIKPFDSKELDKALIKAGEKVEMKNSIHLLEQEEKTNAATKGFAVEVSSKHHNLIKAIEYINENYGDSDLSLSKLAGVLNMSDSYLSRLFKSETQYTFVEFLTKFRLSKAVELLKNPNIKILEVASKVGTRYQRYFSQLFKKYLEMTPNEFKEKSK